MSGTIGDDDINAIRKRLAPYQGVSASISGDFVEVIIDAEYYSTRRGFLWIAQRVGHIIEDELGGN